MKFNVGDKVTSSCDCRDCKGIGVIIGHEYVDMYEVDFNGEHVFSYIGQLTLIEDNTSYDLQNNSVDIVI